VLEQAFKDSAAISQLGGTWGSRFLAAAWEVDSVYVKINTPNPMFIDKIFERYSEREIITILAAARLEGVWTPE
jgi:hypothetical protein